MAGGIWQVAGGIWEVAGGIWEVAGEFGRWPWQLASVTVWQPAAKWVPKY